MVASLKMEEPNDEIVSVFFSISELSIQKSQKKL